MQPLEAEEKKKNCASVGLRWRDAMLMNYRHDGGTHHRQLGW
jgi:hypothetical protein